MGSHASHRRIPVWQTGPNYCDQSSMSAQLDRQCQCLQWKRLNPDFSPCVFTFAKLSDATTITWTNDSICFDFHVMAACVWRDSSSRYFGTFRETKFRNWATGLVAPNCWSEPDWRRWGSGVSGCGNMRGSPLSHGKGITMVWMAMKLPSELNSFHAW